MVMVGFASTWTKTCRSTVKNVRVRSLDLWSRCFLVTLVNLVSSVLVAVTAAQEAEAAFIVGLLSARIGVPCSWVIAGWTYPYFGPVETGGCLEGGT